MNKLKLFENEELVIYTDKIESVEFYGDPNLDFYIVTLTSGKVYVGGANPVERITPESWKDITRLLFSGEGKYSIVKADRCSWLSEEAHKYLGEIVREECPDYFKGEGTPPYYREEATTEKKSPYKKFMTLNELLQVPEAELQFFLGHLQIYKPAVEYEYEYPKPRVTRYQLPHFFKEPNMEVYSHKYGLAFFARGHNGIYIYDMSVTKADGEEVAYIWHILKDLVADSPDPVYIDRADEVFRCCIAEEKEEGVSIRIDAVKEELRDAYPCLVKWFKEKRAWMD